MSYVRDILRRGENERVAAKSDAPSGTRMNVRPAPPFPSVAGKKVTDRS